MRRWLRRLAVGAALIGTASGVSGWSARAAGQRGDVPTFRVEVSSVEVSVRVTDADGQFVRGLTRDDFDVAEDDRPQAITTFSLVDLPPIPPPVSSRERAPDPPEPDVTSNEHPFGGRLYILVLDSLHVLPARTGLVRRAARRFIDDHFAPGDLMAVVHTGIGFAYSQPFTGSKRLLRASAESFVGDAAPSAAVSAYEEYLLSSRASIAASGVGNPHGGEAKTGTTLKQLEGIVDWFGRYVHGRRKSVIFMSEGFPVGFFGNEGGLSPLAREVVRAASRANVFIYSIDPRGLTDASDETIQMNGLKPGDDPNSAAFRAITPAGARNELTKQIDSLRALSVETDAFALVNSNSFANVFNRLVEENSAYYVLSYTQPAPKADGRLHQLTVRVKRPGLRVQARSSYSNPKTVRRPQTSPFAKTLSAEAVTVLDDPLQTSGLTLRVFAVPFRAEARTASVLLGVEARERDLPRAASRLQLTYMVADPTGDVRFVKTGTFTLPAAVDSARRPGVVRAMTRLELAPGRYQVRVIADSQAGPIGSVYHDLEIPDFAKSKLSMSGVALTSMAASHEPNLSVDAALGRVLPAPPVAERVFAVGDAFAAFVEVYDMDKGRPHGVRIAATVRSEEGSDVFKREESRAAGSGDAVFPFLVEVPLADVPPGRYVLSLDAQSSADPGARATRQVPFTVVVP